MALYSDAPPPRKFSDDKPTLLVSWWITIFCMGIILTRLAGRYVRVEKLLREDKIVATALLPLVMRAVCVHFILRYGTNNVNLDGFEMTQEEIDKRVIGSRLVMASRVFYAAVFVHPLLGGIYQANFNADSGFSNSLPWTSLGVSQGLQGESHIFS